jgi:hypothetical protein
MPNPRNSGAASAHSAVALSLAALSVAALLLGCGARALVDGSPDEEEFGTSAAGGRAGAGGRGAGATGGVGGSSTIDPGGPLDPGGAALPDCEPGFSMATAGSRECAYVFRGDCFEDRAAACACACQGLADNQCIIGGFLNPDEPQSVSCIQR